MRSVGSEDSHAAQQAAPDNTGTMETSAMSHRYTRETADIEAKGETELIRSLSFFLIVRSDMKNTNISSSFKR
jgi:hypothetical protein